MAEVSASYPAILSVDYPDRALNRLTTFFRLFVVIPIAIILGMIIGSTTGTSGEGLNFQYASGGLVVLPVVLMLLFRRKYPRWWFDWNLALTRFIVRIEAYVFLLTDVYPSTDEEQSVHIEIPYPDAGQELNRWLPLVKWFLAIPHYIILFFLSIASWIVVIIAWFAILFTGRYPRSMFDFVVGVMRWGLRVTAYAFLLTTDRYPLFNLE